MDCCIILVCLQRRLQGQGNWLCLNFSSGMQCRCFARLRIPGFLWVPWYALPLIKRCCIVVGNFFIIHQGTHLGTFMPGDNKTKAAIRAQMSRNRYEPAGNADLVEQLFCTHDMSACGKQDYGLFAHCAVSCARQLTASAAALISSDVVKIPAEKRMEPSGNVPAVACARGAQCRPTRQSMP